MQRYVGTSGYSYKEWLGRFYPPKHPANAMLRYYAQHFNTVEINNTFYRMPAEAMLARWREEVATRFSFTLKAPRRITHDKRLRDAASDVAEFLRRASALGDRFGVAFFQLPPSMRKDVPLLADFLGILPSDTRPAFEFRHRSWHDDDVYQTLRARGAAHCISDTDEGETPFAVTSTFGYFRLRRTQYDDAALERWIARIREAPYENVYVYFKHEDEARGPDFARRFIELAAAGAA
jgi:uncharacterized protein YecE (DUF72 family)